MITIDRISFFKMSPLRLEISPSHSLCIPPFIIAGFEAIQVTYFKKPGMNHRLTVHDHLIPCDQSINLGYVVARFYCLLEVTYAKSGSRKFCMW